MLSEGHLPGVFPDVFGELLVVEAPLFIAHSDCVVDGICKLFRIPGIDDQTAIKTSTLR